MSEYFYKNIDKEDLYPFVKSYLLNLFLVRAPGFAGPYIMGYLRYFAFLSPLPYLSVPCFFHDAKNPSLRTGEEKY